MASFPKLLMQTQRNLDLAIVFCKLGESSSLNVFSIVDFELNIKIFIGIREASRSYINKINEK